MNKELLQFIRTLSDSDTKSLTQKALKTTEEVGELAKAVLPYENAAGTLHRFVQSKQILENAVDTMLCAMSIAYSLGYTDDEIESMMGEKSRKWSGLQAREAKGKFPLPFEIHVTVSESNVEKFTEDCKAIGVKPIVLDLEKDREVVMVDIMTSSVHYGDNNTAQKEVERISNALKANGYKVVRAKIETVPWHPASPMVSADWLDVSEESYFESHIRIVTTEDRKYELIDIAKRHDAHLSRNYFKKLNKDQYIIMMTLRDYDETREGFEILVQNLKTDLESEDFLVDKAEIEFALYDTDTTHDSVWITKEEDE